MKLLIMNGPNLNLLGQREKDIYGERSFDSYLQELKGMFPEVELDYFQSNVEGELINRIHEARGVYNGVILNAGGYTHTSVALADAIGGVQELVPVVEVHICVHTGPGGVPPHLADRAQMQRIGDGIRTRFVPAGHPEFSLTCLNVFTSRARYIGTVSENIRNNTRLKIKIKTEAAWLPVNRNTR